MNFSIGNHFDKSTPIQIPIGNALLHGYLHLPADVFGIVLFAHGSGSSRFSPRNQYLAEEFNKRGLGTLLLDLLTEEEQRTDLDTMQYRFDIPLLGNRTTQVASWLLQQPGMDQFPIGLFGASTGAAAALIAAAAMKGRIAAVVSRGGRPDLADRALVHVDAPTLLIVGGADEVVLALNRKAKARMQCITDLHIVLGATHLFEEPGALAEVATTATEWFIEHMQNVLNHELVGQVAIR